MEIKMGSGLGDFVRRDGNGMEFLEIRSSEMEIECEDGVCRR